MANGALVGRWGPAALAVAAVTVVAVAAGGTGLRLPSLPAGADGFGRMRLVGLVAALLGGGLLFRLRHRGVYRRDDPTLPSILAAAGLMALLATVSLLAPTIPSPGSLPDRSPEPSSTAAIDPGASGPPPPPSRDAPLTEGRGLGSDVPEPGWRTGTRGGGTPASSPGSGRMPGGSPLLLGLLLVVAVWMALRARRGGDRGEETERPELVTPQRPPGWTPSGVPQEAGAVSGIAADEVVRAYHRLLAALSERGLARHPQEAPFEHLRRAMAGTGIDPAPLERLTELYVRTLFGGVPLPASERAASGRALLRSLEALESLPSKDAGS